MNLLNFILIFHVCPAAEKSTNKQQQTLHSYNVCPSLSLLVVSSRRLDHCSSGDIRCCFLQGQRIRSSGLSTSMPLSSRELWLLPASPLSQTFRCPITHTSCADHPTLGPSAIFAGTEVPFLMLEVKDVGLSAKHR